MRYSEITKEDISRRDLIRGAAGLAGASALGYAGSKLAARGGDNSQEDDAATASDKNSLSGAQKSLIPKYSSEQLKDYIIKYAKQTLPANQVVPFIAQVAHESANFRSLEENLNYSPAVLIKKYPKLFNQKTAEQVAAHPQRDQIIANRIYANRMGNGDYASGDGYRYRGRGFIQLTGRENYDRMSKKLNVDLVNNPDLAADPKYAAQIAILYWQTRVANKVNTTNLGQVTKKISGSSRQGIESRREKLRQYSKELGKK